MCVLVLYVCTYLCVCVHACVRVHMHTHSGKNICKRWTAGLPGSPKVRVKIEQAIIKFCTCPVNVYYYTALVLAEIYFRPDSGLQPYSNGVTLLRQWHKGGIHEKLCYFKVQKDSSCA